MKKILCFMTVLIAFIWVSNTFASSISQTELDKQTKEGNILSDGYTSQSECTNLKEKYNQEFSNYKRSDCFSNGGKYHYFICPSSSACSVNVTETSSVTSQTFLGVPNQDKLDIFLNKLVSMRKEFNDDAKYKLLLTQVKGQLQTLGSKYKSNTTISQMLSYLDSGIQKIQTELENNTDVDNFLCELLGNCNVKKPSECPVLDPPLCKEGTELIVKGSYKTTDGCEYMKYECQIKNQVCPMVDPPFCKNGNPIAKWTYKTANGCELVKYECPAPISCPVQMPPLCQPGEVSYTKSVFKNADGCEITDFACRPISTTSSSSSSSSGWATTPLFEHKNAITQETKTTYYIDEKINLVSKNLWKNVVWCMEQVGVPSTSCSISSNWIPLPPPWIYVNNEWKYDNLVVWMAWSFIGYHKDLDTGKQAKMEFTISNQKQPPYLKTANITYKWDKKLDVYRPINVASTQKVPVVFIIHGWWWVEGTTKDSPVMVDFWKYFHQNGMAYIPISYTLSNATRSGYDKVYQEIDCALQWVHANKDTYHFDTNNITVWWWSAWAHLALQYTLNQSSYQDTSCPWNVPMPKFQKVLPIATPTDLTKDFTKTEAGDITNLLESFLWAKRWTPQFIERAKLNSPVNFVNKDNKHLKYYMVHGLTDGLVTYKDHALPMYNLLKNNGYDIVLDTKINGHDGGSISSPEMIQFLKN